MLIKLFEPADKRKAVRIDAVWFVVLEGKKRPTELGVEVLSCFASSVARTDYSQWCAESSAHSKAFQVKLNLIRLIKR